MHGVEHDHAFADFGRVVLEAALAVLAAPDPERLRGHGYLFSSITCFSSAGIAGIGARVSVIAPSAPFSMTKLNVLNSSDLAG